MNHIKVIKLFERNSGYMNTTELIKNRVHTSTIRSLVQQGFVEQIKRGLYRLPAEQLPQHDTFTFDYFDAAVAIPNGVFCLTTALFHHALTTTKPAIFDIAIPQTQRNAKLYSVSVQYYRFNEPYYSLDVEKIKTQITTIKMYGKEKSVCDAIRLRHIIGENVAMEGLNTYIRNPRKDINKLLKFAEICKVKHIIGPAVKAMIGF